MALVAEDRAEIGQMIQQALAQPNSDLSASANLRYELELRERTIRVEEELKHQRELMQQGFAQMERRFEQVDKRFEEQCNGFKNEMRELSCRHDRQFMWLSSFIAFAGGVVVAAVRLL
ncbi:hypothetical protein D5085_07015 [Ectothiorhodospiraceae bacterium BW-2]|nr:hypothetical protein D5085_07015 [Ectothiorhodospiraceae bacterium BW-2]